MTMTTPETGAGPLVTVYMTVKNGFPYIREAINSIINQSYPNWEAVIVDDGSSDGTIEYLSELSRIDTRIRLIKTGGVGRGKALNIALNVASGKYVANLDADDLCHPQRIEVQVSLLETNGFDFISAESIICHDSRKVEWEWFSQHNGRPITNVSSLILRRNCISHVTVMANREFILRHGGYDENRKSQFDYELWLRLAASGALLFKVKLSLAAKRIHKRQSFENKKRASYLISCFQLQMQYCDNLDGRLNDKIVIMASLIYGFLPQQLRMYSPIRSLVRKWMPEGSS